VRITRSSGKKAVIGKCRDATFACGEWQFQPR